MLKNNSFTNFSTPVMVVLLIVAAFYIGRLSSQVDGLKKGSGSDTTAPVGNNQGPAAPERKLDVASMKERAKKFGLNADQFNQCLDDGKMADRVANEQKEGAALGVSGTPSFLINGILLVGAQPETSFDTIIDAELKNGGGPAASKAVGGDGKRQKLNLADGYVFGAKDAKIKMIEFTDFECPFCERAFPTISAVMKKYEGKISLEYKSFPLSFHPSAQKAAEAALCAGEQGKFWEMHDDIFAPAK